MKGFTREQAFHFIFNHQYTFFSNLISNPALACLLPEDIEQEVTILTPLEDRQFPANEHLLVQYKEIELGLRAFANGEEIEVDSALDSVARGLSSYNYDHIARYRFGNQLTVGDVLDIELFDQATDEVVNTLNLMVADEVDSPFSSTVSDVDIDITTYQPLTSCESHQYIISGRVWGEMAQNEWVYREISIGGERFYALPGYSEYEGVTSFEWS